MYCSTRLQPSLVGYALTGAGAVLYGDVCGQLHSHTMTPCLFSAGYVCCRTRLISIALQPNLSVPGFMGSVHLLTAVPLPRVCWVCCLLCALWSVLEQRLHIMFATIVRHRRVRRYAVLQAVHAGVGLCGCVLVGGVRLLAPGFYGVSSTGVVWGPCCASCLHTKPERNLPGADKRA